MPIPISTCRLKTVYQKQLNITIFLFKIIISKPKIGGLNNETIHKFNL